MAKPRYLNQREAARYIGLSERHLRHLETRGEGPLSAKIGRSKRYDVADLDAWMEERKAPHTGD